jgi:hypothetical protein
MKESDFKNLAQIEKWETILKYFYKTQPNFEEFTFNPDDNIAYDFEPNKQLSPLRDFFFKHLNAAEFHWFFIQGVEALIKGYYIPAVSTFLNGIEASLRITICQVSNPGHNNIELSSYKVLSNNLIKNAKELGLPTSALAFSNEKDFETKLETLKPNIINVEIVKQRNNICHGNILEFINTELGDENSFFTPECLRELSFELLNICGNWVEQLGIYRKEKIISKSSH